MLKILFFAPGAFFFKFHCRSAWRGISWIFTTITPLLFISNAFEITWWNFVFSLLIMMAIYDCGYIYNDVITFQHEEKTTATDRLGDLRIVWSQNVNAILSVRVAVVFMLSIAHFVMFGSAYAIAIFWLLMATFLIYNLIRGHWGLLLYIPLNFLKFFSTLTLTGNLYEAAYIVVIFFTIPTLLCWLGKKKFQIFNWQKGFSDFELVRLSYFMIVFTVLHISPFDIFYELSLYMLILRICYFVVAKGSYAKSILRRIRVK